jgi:acyl-CoA thioester hydrolase
MEDYEFELEFQVRDYECDLQGVVNNAVYQNYLEHTRHEYLNSVGLNFAELNAAGIVPHVVRAEIDYKKALHSGDRFVSRLKVGIKGKLRLIFQQEIRLLPGMELVNSALITAACLVKGRPAMPEVVKEAIKSNGRKEF